MAVEEPYQGDVGSLSRIDVFTRSAFQRPVSIQWTVESPDRGLRRRTVWRLLSIRKRQAV